MCIYALPQPTVTTKNLYAYKRVERTRNPDVFRSSTPPGSRERQTGFKSSGKRKTYRIGKAAVSRFTTTPGIYLFAKKPENYDSPTRAVIKVRVPKGTRVRKAPLGDRFTAERVEVLKAFKR